MSVDYREQQSDESASRRRRRRRHLNQRNVVIATVAGAVGIIALVLLAVLVYRWGSVDVSVPAKKKNIFSKSGFGAETREFHPTFPPQTVEMLGLDLYD